MKHFLTRLKMYLVSECYCFEVENDNRHCPAHGRVGKAVRFIAGVIIAAILFSLLIAYLKMPSL